MTYRSTIILSVLFALGAAPALLAADAVNEQPKIPVEQIIQKFVEKETEFSKARESYTYRQTVKLTEYNEATVRAAAGSSYKTSSSDLTASGPNASSSPPSRTCAGSR